MEDDGSQRIRLSSKFQPLLVLADLLELPHLPLGARLTNQLHSVDADSLSITITLLHIDDQTGGLLELDESQANIDSSVSVPIVSGQLDRLGGFGVVCFAKVEVLGPVDVEMDGARSHRRLVIVVVVVLGRQGSDLWHAVRTEESRCNRTAV